MKRAAICGLLFHLFACGGDRKDVPVLPHSSGGTDEPEDTPDSGRKPDAGKPETDGGMLDPLAPVVTFEALTPADDPNDDSVITDADLTVRCKVAKAIGGAAIEKSMVKISMYGSDPTKLVSPTVNAQPDDVYEAIFDLSKQPNGPITFRCEGRDTSSKQRMTTTSVQTLLDLGPEVDFFDPTNMGIYTLKTPVTIKFQVKAAPLTDADNEADVKEVKLMVGGVDTPISESGDTPGLYQTSIDFDDRTKYPVPPTAAQFEVTATNARTPTAATRRSKVEITIDGDGPMLKVQSPTNGKIVRGTVTLEVTASDPAGLMPGSLVANINDGLLIINDWKGSGPNFNANFDTRNTDNFDPNLTQLTINVSATDGVGNQTTVQHQLKLDNKPPYISLDPPKIRERRANSTICSVLFDPVGPDAASDLDRVLVGKRFRALVEDDTNRAPGAVAYIAGVKTDSVELFVQPNTSIPLLTDSDGDGKCDEIKNRLKEDATKPTKIQLASVTPGGTAWYANDISGMPDPPPSCTEDTASMSMPLSLCPGFSGMFRVVPGRVQGKPPAVYGYRPSNDPAVGECHGESWELLSIVDDGWVCMAARVEDTIGNIGVSPPIHICFDDNKPENGTPACDPSQRPNCTESCSIVPTTEFGDGDVWLQQ